MSTIFLPDDDWLGHESFIEDCYIGLSVAGVCFLFYLTLEKITILATFWIYHRPVLDRGETNP